MVQKRHVRINDVRRAAIELGVGVGVGRRRRHSAGGASRHVQAETPIYTICPWGRGVVFMRYSSKRQRRGIGGAAQRAYCARGR